MGDGIGDDFFSSVFALIFLSAMADVDNDACVDADVMGVSVGISDVECEGRIDGDGDVSVDVAVDAEGISGSSAVATITVSISSKETDALEEACDMFMRCTSYI